MSNGGLERLIAYNSNSLRLPNAYLCIDQRLNPNSRFTNCSIRKVAKVDRSIRDHLTLVGA